MLPREGYLDSRWMEGLVQEQEREQGQAGSAGSQVYLESEVFPERLGRCRAEQARRREIQLGGAETGAGVEVDRVWCG